MTDPRILTWLSEQFGSVQHKLGELHAQTLTNRETLFEVHRHLTGRMDHLTTRMDQVKDSKNGKYGWMRHIPWSPVVKITALVLATILVITGHISPETVKGWLIEKLRTL